jgi:hypothetical protein
LRCPVLNNNLDNNGGLAVILIIERILNMTLIREFKEVEMETHVFRTKIRKKGYLQILQSAMTYGYALSMKNILRE